MAKPDFFRLLGCILMVTLIIVIAVKLSKQCSKSVHQMVVSSPTVQGFRDECPMGQFPNESGVCVPKGRS
uniref:Uncharacterized protein n=1 Tax=viral metagenome TaxID=1070528 RepID=A0A6C0L7A7_9ZZZZ